MTGSPLRWECRARWITGVRSYMVSAVNLWCESAQLSILPEGTLSGSSSPANSLNLARSGRGNDGVLARQTQLLAAQNQVPLPVGNSYVFINLTQNKMWYMQFGDGTIGPQWGDAMSHLAQFSLGYSGGAWNAGPYPTVYQEDINGKNQRGPGGGWRFPTYQECYDLRSLAQASDQYGLRRLVSMFRTAAMCGCISTATPNSISHDCPTVTPSIWPTTGKRIRL